jgi:hypothetical protein
VSHGPARSCCRILLVFASLLALAAAPAAAQEPGVNLLANGDAEAGTAAPDSSVVAPPPLWSTIGEFTQIAYGASGGFPDAPTAAAIGGGKAFFGGGNVDISAGTQNVDVSSSATDIDAGGVVATISALLGGFGGQEDNAQVFVTLRDGAGADTGSMQIGPVTNADRKGQTTLLPRQASVPVRAGTRSIEVNVVSTRVDGSYNDGYADNVSLTLGSATPPKAGKTAGGATVSGTVLVRRPGTTRYIALGSQGDIPVGTIVDATKGAVQLTIAVEGGKARKGIFAGGIFKFTEPKEKVGHKRRFTAHLALRGGKFGACSTRSFRVDAGIARKRVVRYLAAQANGRFRVIGKNSSGVERGTTWTTSDRCDGTLTAVAKGAVVVTDFAKRKNVVVKAGHSYLARARG